MRETKAQLGRGGQYPPQDWEAEEEVEAEEGGAGRETVLL